MSVLRVDGARGLALCADERRRAQTRGDRRSSRRSRAGDALLVHAGARSPRLEAAA